jgi:hypothetical protein
MAGLAAGEGLGLGLRLTGVFVAWLLVKNRRHTEAFLGEGVALGLGDAVTSACRSVRGVADGVALGAAVALGAGEASVFFS